MSLFDIEIKSHWLKEQLGRPHSTRLRLLYLSDFLSELIKSEAPGKYISYYNEFTPELVKLILKNEFQYFSPYEIENLSFIVKSLEALSFSKEDLGKCIAILQNASNEILSLLTGNDNKEVKSHRDSLNVVLIETNGDEKRNVGTVQTLTLRSSKRGKEFLEDKIEFENLCDSDHEKLSTYIANIAAFSKEQAKEVISKSGAYNLTFFFGNKDCSYTGSSFGLALLALTYNSILVNELHRIHYRFYDDVVITGAIDENGNLLKLDTLTLKVKIETVFFSHFNKFIIPEDNIIEAKEILAELRKEYPQRKLELIPCANFKSLFQNLAVVEVHKLRFKEKLKANYERYHRTINWAFTFIALLAIVYLFINYAIPYLDRNPVYADKRNDHFIAYNKYGKEAWESGTLNPYEIGGGEIRKRIIISDLDNDGKNEIIFLRRDNNQRKLSKTIFCYNADNTLQWETVIVPKDSIYGSELCYDYLDLRTLDVSENKINKQKEIITTYTICNQFPFFISKIDSRGKEISSFYHPGHLHNGELIDINNDGEVEFVIGGQNNDYDHRGCLIVLDPSLITGMAPAYRYPRGFNKGLMKYYILFPKTSFSKFSSQQTSTVRTFTKMHDKIEFALFESCDYTLDKQTSHYRLLLTFDDKFNFLHFSTSTEFDNFYNKLIEDGKISPIKDWRAFEDAFRKEIMFWDGDKFVNYPTMNKYYLAARDSLDKRTKKK